MHNSTDFFWELYYFVSACLLPRIIGLYKYGARGSVVVKALCHKPEGRGFDTRRGEFLLLPNPSGRTRP
jgi:hypothetical protein